MAVLTEYTGNAGLGVGSSGASAPLGPNDNLKVINDTSRDIMLLDAERNTKIFQQKVKDRDDLTDLILKNQVKAGEIDPKYHHEYDSAQADVEKAYDAWGGNFNDKDGYRKYQEKVTHLQDVATHAQTNTIELKKLIQQRSQETLPWKQKELDDHIAKQQSKDFWGHVDPYQQMFSFSIDPINKLYKTTTTSVTSPDKLWKMDITHSDYAGTLKAAQGEYLNHGEASEDMRQFLDKVDNYDPVQKQAFVESINSQLQKHNGQLGLQPGDPGYADPIQTVMGPDNKMHVKASPVDFAAKYALAQQDKFLAQGQPQFQKDYGAYQAKLADTAIKKAKLGVDWYNAATRRGMLSLKQKAADRMTPDEKEFSQTYDKIGDAIVLPQPSATGKVLLTGKSGEEAFALPTSSIPEGSTYINGLGPNGQPLQLLPKGVDFSKDAKVKDPGIVRDKSGNVIAYKGGNGHYDTNFFVPAGATIRGKKVSKDIHLTPKEMYKLYTNGVNRGYAGSFQEFVKGMLSDNEIDYQIEGSNGKADRVSSYVSQRALSNKDTKKGQQTPYDSDELDLFMSQADAPDEPETPPQQ